MIKVCLFYSFLKDGCPSLSSLIWCKPVDDISFNLCSFIAGLTLSNKIKSFKLKEFENCFPCEVKYK